MADVASGVKNYQEEFDRVWNKLAPLILSFAKQAVSSPALSNVGTLSTAEGAAVAVPVVQHATDEQLHSAIDFSLSDSGRGLERIAQDLERIFQYSVRTGHCTFYDKLYAGTDVIGMLGELAISALNANVHTFESAPVLTMIERELVLTMCKLVGFAEEESDGIFSPGGSYSNMFAMFAALQHHRLTYPQTDKPRYAVLTSSQAHYSILTAANLLGLSDCLEKLETDSVGRIKVESLESTNARLHSEGKVPFFLVMTAGTTVMGSYDHFEPLIDIAHRYKLWTHVDAAWGGSVLVSPRLRHLMAGCERATSVAWNPHKMMHIPLQCSVLLVRGLNLLEKVNVGTSSASYLFHGGSPRVRPVRQKSIKRSPDSLVAMQASGCDIGLKTLQCGRRADALKLWLAWRYHGTEGFAAFIDRSFSLAQHLFRVVCEHPHFLTVVDDEPQCLNVCFWYVPTSIREELGRDKVTSSDRPMLLEKYSSRLACTTKTVFKRLRYEGLALVDIAPLPGFPQFLRPIINNGVNPNVTPELLERLLVDIEVVGVDL